MLSWVSSRILADFWAPGSAEKRGAAALTPGRLARHLGGMRNSTLGPIWWALATG